MIEEKVGNSQDNDKHESKVEKMSDDEKLNAAHDNNAFEVSTQL